MRASLGVFLPHGLADIVVTSAFAPMLSKIRILILLARQALMPDSAALKAVLAFAEAAADLFTTSFLDLIVVVELAAHTLVGGTPSETGARFKETVGHALEMTLHSLFAKEVLKVCQSPSARAQGTLHDRVRAKCFEEVVI